MIRRKFRDLSLYWHTFYTCNAIQNVVLEANCLNEWISWVLEVQVGQQLRRERANRVATSNQSSQDQQQQQQLQTVEESDGYQSEHTESSNNTNNGPSQIYSCNSNSCTILNTPSLLSPSPSPPSQTSPPLQSSPPLPFTPTPSPPSPTPSPPSPSSTSPTSVVRQSSLTLPTIKIPSTPSLHRVKHTFQQLQNINHNKSTTLIPDSGATSTFSGAESHFEYILPLPQNDDNTLLLGDDVTKYNILGVGPMNVLLNGNRVRMIAYYVPELSTTLLSITKHIEYAGCYFHAEDNTYTLAYPRAVIHPTLINEPIINIQSAKHLPSTTTYAFDYLQDPLSTNESTNDRKAYRLIDSNRQKYLPTIESQLHQSDTVTFQKLHPNAKIPTRSTEGSIGFDVSSPVTFTLPPNQITKIPTGLAASFPSHLYL